MSDYGDEDNYEEDGEDFGSEDAESDESEKDEESESDEEYEEVVEVEGEVVIDPQSKNTFPRLSNFEITRILEARCKQLQAQAPTYVKHKPGEKIYQLALRELQESKCPIRIKRLDPYTFKTKFIIDPNSINPNTGERWFQQGDFQINMY